MLEGRRGAALGLTFFLGLGAYGIWSEISSRDGQTHQAPKHASDETKTNIDPRPPEERIADYTLWLERFTGLLALVSTVQIFFLIRADRTARISADAAKAAADAALLALDRPWLHIESLRNILTNPTPQTERPIAGFKITNHGKAPASILSIKAILFYSPGRQLERNFPIKPLPITMRDFPKANILGTFRYKNTKDPVDSTKPSGITRRSVENLVIPISYTTREFCFPCDVMIEIPDKGIPVEFAVHLYLIGHIIYTMPHEETEILSFCYEAKWRGEFSPIYGAPYNERKKAY
jgi:hypothetical protein